MAVFIRCLSNTEPSTLAVSQLIMNIPATALPSIPAACYNERILPWRFKIRFSSEQERIRAQVYTCRLPFPMWLREGVFILPFSSFTVSSGRPGVILAAHRNRLINEFEVSRTMLMTLNSSFSRSRVDIIPLFFRLRVGRTYPPGIFTKCMLSGAIPVPMVPEGVASTIWQTGNSPVRKTK